MLVSPENPVVETQFVVFRASPIHGIGGFAKTNIPSRTRVLEYVGNRIDKQESLRRCEKNNEYIFALDSAVDLDGNVPWNPARYLNHSCAPNCEAEIEEGRIWLFALRDICAGEELTFNYGYDLVDYHEHPCYCGSPSCVGFIVAEEFFKQVKNGRKDRSNPST